MPFQRTLGRAMRGFRSMIVTGLVSAPLFAAEPVTVLVENQSTMTTCAEEDNVTYAFRAEQPLRSFKVASALPPYMDSVVQDMTDADFTHCPATPPPAPVNTYTPPPITLYQDNQIALRGLIDPRFWRPRKASVRIDQIEWPFLDLVQLWKKTPSGFIEVLVFYPQDGYWRIKSLPPRRFAEVSYGSSFLLGPIETDAARPYVAYKRITFDWKTLSFGVELAKGGKLKVQLTGLGDEATSEVTVSFDPPLPKGTAFSSIRSMYVGPGNHDTEHVTTRTALDAAPVRTPVMAFKSSRISEITFGRTEMSKHNVSAPDIRYFDFTQ